MSRGSCRVLVSAETSRHNTIQQMSTGTVLAQRMVDAGLCDIQKILESKPQGIEQVQKPQNE
jgi:hypothetical protein